MGFLRLFKKWNNLVLTWNLGTPLLKGIISGASLEDGVLCDNSELLEAVNYYHRGLHYIKEKSKNKRQKRTKSWLQNYSERVWAKWFSCVFTLSFFQLICKVCLIFRSNLEFYQLFQRTDCSASQNMLYMLHMLKNMNCMIFFYMLLNPGFKMTCFGNLLGKISSHCQEYGFYMKRFF